MKKLIFASIGLLSAVAVCVSVFAYQTQSSQNALINANVEALANTEGTPCKNAEHCQTRTNQTCWYYNVTGDGNMMVASYDDYIHYGPSCYN